MNMGQATAMEPLKIFSYLTVSSPRIRFYQILMRTFFLAYRDTYEHYLQETMLYRAVREQLDPSYTLEDCCEDLAFLEDHGNVMYIIDEQRPIHSIAEFTQRARLYRATENAMAIEHLLDAFYYSGNTRVKTLHKETLEEMHDLLLRLDSLLMPSVNTLDESLDVSKCEQIAQMWQHVFDLWKLFSQDASAYAAMLDQAARQRQDEQIDHFLQFKDATLYYVQHIAQALSDFSPAISALFERWQQDEKKQHLIECVVAQQQRTTYTKSQDALQETVSQDVEQQFSRFHAWFTDHGQQTLFRYKASEAVKQVVSRASLFIWARRSSVQLTRSLRSMAHHLAIESSLETARQLYALAFSCVPSTLYGQSIFGLAERQLSSETNPWEDPVPCDLPLRKIGSRERYHHQKEAPLRDDREHIRRLQQAQLEEEAQQVACFYALFHPPHLDLGTLSTLEEPSRDLLLEVIDECLLDTHHRYVSHQGLTFYLQNPEEQHWITIACTDGTLHIPRYQFVLESEG